MVTKEIRGTFHFLQQENIRLKQENDLLREEVIHLRLILRTLGKLSQTAVTISPRTNIMQLLNQILVSALTSIKAQDGSLLLVDEEKEELVFVAVHGRIRDKLLHHRIPIGMGIAGWVAQYAEPQIIGNVYTDPRFSGDVDKIFEFKTRSMICVPILRDERVMGVIQALNKRNRKEFSQTDLILLGIVAQLAANVLAKAESVSD